MHGEGEPYALLPVPGIQATADVEAQLAFWTRVVGLVEDGEVAAELVAALKRDLMACCLGAESVRRDIDARLDEKLVVQQVRAASPL